MEELIEFRAKHQIPENMRLYKTDHFMIYVGIETNETSKIVTIYAPLYMNKVRVFSVSYSLDFNDASILKCHYLTTHLSNSYK